MAYRLSYYKGNNTKEVINNTGNTINSGPGHQDPSIPIFASASVNPNRLTLTYNSGAVQQSRGSFTYSPSTSVWSFKGYDSDIIQLEITPERVYVTPLTIGNTTITCEHALSGTTLTVHVTVIGMGSGGGGGNHNL